MAWSFLCFQHTAAIIFIILRLVIVVVCGVLIFIKHANIFVFHVLCFELIVGKVIIFIIVFVILPGVDKLPIDIFSVINLFEILLFDHGVKTVLRDIFLIRDRSNDVFASTQV